MGPGINYMYKLESLAHAHTYRDLSKSSSHTWIQGMSTCIHCTSNTNNRHTHYVPILFAGLPTLTHLAWFSRIWPVTHALTQLTILLTHLKKITRILTQFYKIENNLLFLIIVSVRLSVILFIVFLLQIHSL